MPSTPLPWQPTDDSAYETTACLRFGGELFLYGAAFREGADQLLVALRAAGDDFSRDKLAYPLVYCLRHSVELALKQVIRAARGLLDEPTRDFPDGHNLGNLWNTCRPLLERVWASPDPSYATVEAAVLGLLRIDPEGEGFRYPLSTRSKKTGGERLSTLDEGLTHLDLQRLHDDVIAALDLLDGADTGIDVYLDYKQDMEEEYRTVQAEMQAEMNAEYRDYYD